MHPNKWSLSMTVYRPMLRFPVLSRRRYSHFLAVSPNKFRKGDMLLLVKKSPYEDSSSLPFRLRQTTKLDNSVIERVGSWEATSVWAARVCAAGRPSEGWAVATSSAAIGLDRALPSNLVLLPSMGSELLADAARPHRARTFESRSCVFLLHYGRIKQSSIFAHRAGD